MSDLREEFERRVGRQLKEREEGILSEMFSKLELENKDLIEDAERWHKVSVQNIMISNEYERENAELKKERDELINSLAQAEDNQREAEIDLEVLVNIVPQKYLDEAMEERASR